MEEMGSVGRGEKRQRLVEQGVELFCEERGVLWTELVAEESLLVSREGCCAGCRGEGCGFMKTRRQKGEGFFGCR